MKKTTNINEVIKEIKEYQAMQDELKRQIEALKQEAVEYLESNEIDEYTCEEGKVTYREVLSNRLDTTALKKSEWSEVYDMFVKQTSSMRFTCNQVIKVEGLRLLDRMYITHITIQKEGEFNVSVCTILYSSCIED